MLFTKDTPKNIRKTKLKIKGLKKIPGKYHANVMQHFNMKQNVL